MSATPDDDAPLWQARPTAFDIAPAAPGRVTAIDGTIQMSEGNSNAYQVVTPEGRIIINTGMGYEGPTHRANFDRFDRGPVRYIVFTQGHVDHVGGTDAFREADTDIVAQANNEAQQAYDARLATFRTRRAYFAWAASIDRKQGTGGAPTPVQARPQPTIRVEHEHAFTLGGVRVVCHAVAGAETEDSLVVWLPERRVCFAGNVFGALFGHFPNLVTIRGDRYRDPLRYVEALELLLALEPDVLLVGHGGPVEGRARIRREIERMRAAVLHVHDAVVAAMNAGGDVWGAMRTIRLPPSLAVGEGYGKVAWSVRAIWELYQGWFHGRATSELYPTPPWTVSPTLVALAGGAAVVAGAAQERLVSAPVEALHLAEAALAADPACRPALAASRDAHRHLLDGCQNFWERRWLESQIRRLEQALAEA
jgi:alkyl sulfatase BDS1-like metallo-beta-lactamase superfamily hydrolase